ncbi:MAG: hypothetical protein GTO40_07455 [Deltaproteobacteria bacterium]|nr:hypothetical protein [Deltaproteobacteria bacterium]
MTLVIGSGDSEIGGIGTPMIVGNKKFQFGFCNPAGVGRMAALGKGFYKRKIPLRAIGVFPSWDRLVFAVHKDTGIRSLEEIKERRYPLIVSTRLLGKYRGTVLAVEEILKAYGFSLSDIEKWGGKILRVTNPGSPERARHITEGIANAVFDEGIKNWGSRALNSGMRFLPIEEKVLGRLERIGLSRSTLSPAYFPELSEEVPTFDFSGWLLFCRPDLSSQIAYAMAKAIDVEHSRIPVDHFDKRPMTMEEFCRGGEGGPLTLPLHPGAKKYYREKGYIA